MKISIAHTRDRLLPILLSQAIGLICGMLGVRILSHWVEPGVLGSYGVFLTFTTMGHWLVHAGIIKFITSHWALAQDQGGLWRACLRSWAAKLVWLVPAAAAAAWFINQLGGPPPLVTAGPLFIAAAFASLGVLSQSALQAGRRYWTDFAVSAVGSITRTFAPPILFLVMSQEAGLYLGFGIHALCFASAAFWTLRKYCFASARNPTPIVIPPVYDGIFFATLSAVIWTLSGMNRWIMAGFFGETQAGLFTLAGNLAQIIPAMLGAVFMQYFQPGFFTAPHSTVSERWALARRVDILAGAYTLIALGGVVALHGLAPWLIGPIIAENYRPAIGYVVGAGCFSIAVSSGQFFHVMLLAVKNERACGPVDLGLAVVLITGGLLAASLGGEDWFIRWLLITPLIPWLLARPLARFYILRQDTTGAH